jgi:hypothetical protein
MEAECTAALQQQDAMEDGATLYCRLSWKNLAVTMFRCLFFYSVNTYPAHASFMNDYGRGMMLGLTKSPVVSMSSQSIQPIVFGALNI